MILARKSPAAALAIATLALLAGTEASAQEEGADPSGTVRLVGVRVEPERPAADTLCRLWVVLENQGESKASQLAFSVRINGQELPVYGNQLFMYLVEPGASTELPLYNFWSTESGRGAPADGKLKLEVSLKEAVWMEIQIEGDTETWNPLGAVPGLPSTLERVLEMAPES